MVTTLLCGLVLGGTGVRVRVDGDGYLRFVRTGLIVYAKVSTLKVQDGMLSSAEGYPLAPRLAVTGNTANLKIDLEGNVSAGGKTVGRIVIAMFPGSTKFTQKDGFYRTTGVRASLANPGEGLAGVIRCDDQPANETPAHVATHETYAPGRATVTFPSRAESNSEDVILGEVAQIEGDPAVVAKLATLTIGKTPTLGIDRPVKKTDLQARIQAIGFSPDAIEVICPLDATVSRKTDKVTSTELVKCATDAIAAQFHFTGELRPLQAQTDLIVPPGDHELVSGVPTRNGGSMSVVVTIRVNGKDFKQRTVSLCAVDPTGVKARDAITIRITRKGGVVTTPGKARSNGWVGETIQVETAEGAVLNGVVKSDGTVEVKL